MLMNLNSMMVLYYQIKCLPGHPLLQHPNIRRRIFQAKMINLSMRIVISLPPKILRPIFLIYLKTYNLMIPMFLPCPILRIFFEDSDSADPDMSHCKKTGVATNQPFRKRDVGVTNKDSDKNHIAEV